MQACSHAIGIVGCTTYDKEQYRDVIMKSQKKGINSIRELAMCMSSLYFVHACMCYYITYISKLICTTCRDTRLYNLRQRAVERHDNETTEERYK